MYESMKVAQAVREIVAENPEVVYKRTSDGCLYTKGKAGDSCGCLIGQAIIRVYPELEEKLKDIDDKISPMAGTLLNSHLYFDETKASKWLNSVQHYQDGGSSWEHCVKTADQYWPLS